MKWCQIVLQDSSFAIRTLRVGLANTSVYHSLRNHCGRAVVHYHENAPIMSLGSP